MAYTVIEAGLLQTGTASLPLRDAAVLIAGDRIVSAGPAAALDVPPGARVYRFPQLTLMPGMVDCHSHVCMAGDGPTVEEIVAEGEAMMLLRSARNTRITLESGVTTLSDNGAHGSNAFEIKRGIAAGIVPGPRLFVCGRPLTMTGGHGWPMGGEVDGADGMRRAVRQLLKEGADYIKLMASGGSTRNTPRCRASFTIEEMRVAVEEAHGWGRRVIAHATSNEAIANSLAAGVDMICHCSFYKPAQWEASWPSPPPFAARFGLYCYDAELTQQIVDRGIPVHPTMQTHRYGVQKLERLQEQRGLSEDEAAELAARRERYAERCDYFQRLLRAGVDLTAGSDAGWGSPFGNFAGEIEAMVDAGMSAADAFRAGTLRSAVSMGVGEQVGSIEKGKLADMILVDGDPAEDVSALRRVRAVFLAGQQISLPTFC